MTKKGNRSSEILTTQLQRNCNIFNSDKLNRLIQVWDCLLRHSISATR